MTFPADEGYHQISSDPFLHTWSLGAEFQIYIFFFIFIIVCYNFYKSVYFRINFIFFIIITSFLLCLFFHNFSSNINFYSPITRSWEFFFGSLIAYKEENIKIVSNKILINLLSLFSILSILFFTKTLNSNSFHPGFLTIFPVLSTGILIITLQNQVNIFYKFFNNSGLSFVGKFSYSLYIWHYPIIIFYIMFFNNSLSYYETISLFVVSILISLISYYFIEESFKKIKNNNFNIKIFFTAICACILLIIFFNVTVSKKFLITKCTWIISFMY